VLQESAERENMTSGGSVLTEVRELIVIAAGPLPASAVTTETPAGCIRNADLNVSVSMDSLNCSGGTMVWNRVAVIMGFLSSRGMHRGSFALARS
jgi:hypothetical protein